VSATVILNTRSSRTTRESGHVRTLLDQRGVAVDAFHEVDGTKPLLAAIKRARKAGARTLIIGGGDGTMTQSANELAHSKVTLGVLPLGTGNSFAMTLGIGEDLERAVDIIAAGRSDFVDLGRVNKRYFANFATVGFAAEVAAATNHDLKARIGPLAYVAAAVPPFLRERGFRAKVRWKRERLDVRTQQLVIVNGRFFGDQPISGHATDQDGTLRVFVTEGTSRFELLKTYTALGLGLQGRLPEGHLLKGKRFTIRAKPKAPLNIDGDAFGSTPARFSVARKALRVFLPGDAT
jgi:YegS/Rv2252/BmrU family lipid kinase